MCDRKDEEFIVTQFVDHRVGETIQKAATHGSGCSHSGGRREAQRILLNFKLRRENCVQESVGHAGLVILIPLCRSVDFRIDLGKESGVQERAPRRWMDWRMRLIASLPSIDWVSPRS